MSATYRFDKAVDLSQPLENGMPIYPGDAVPSFKPYKTLSKDGVNLTRLTLGSHTGTHVDAPMHFIQGGKTVDEIRPSAFIGEALVADLSSKRPGTGVTAADLRRALGGRDPEGMVVVVFTGCSRSWGEESMNSGYTYLTKGGAEYLVGRKVRGVGIDFLSVEKFGARVPETHRTLLGNGVYIVESLSKSIEEFVGRRFLLMCFPLRLKGRDAAPCRAVGVPAEKDPKSGPARRRKHI
jgi:arylformamidase